jgi:hypothetical protein
VTVLGSIVQFLADSSQPLVHRAVAAWFASGINWRYDQQVRGGDLRALAAAYRDLGAGEELSHSIVLAARKGPEPLVILVPLVWLEVQRSGPARVRSDPVPQTKAIGGVPLYAFDTHTRIGKRAIERLISENKPLRDCIVRLQRPRSRRSMRTAPRYRDGSTGRNRIRERLGIEADFDAAGLRRDGIGPVREAMNAALGQLNEIRAELWTAALASRV